MHPSMVKVAASLHALGVAGQVTELPDPAPTVFPTSFAELVRITGGTLPTSAPEPGTVRDHDFDGTLIPPKS